MTNERLVIVDGVRTPFSKMGTDFAALGPEDLGRVAVQALLTRTGIDPAIIDEVIIGCVAQPADAANVARVIALRAGIPYEVPAITVHRNCASGMEAITQAAEKVAAGRGEVFVVGGAESMTSIPLLYNEGAVKKYAALARAKSAGQRLGVLASFRPRDFAPIIGLQLGLHDPFSDLNMGQTAELIGREAGITREMQDAFALASHRKAIAAKGRLAEEIAPVYDERKGTAVEADNGPRPDGTPEKLAKLKPVFEKGTGTVTAGNASQITDGAVALLVMSESRARRENVRPLGILTGYAYAANDPARMGLGPVFALDRAERATGLRLQDADLVEINEAFAAQVLACLVALESPDFAREKLGRQEPLGAVDESRLNVNGGAIALGHPVGASGARLVLTSLLELRRRGGRRAVSSLCVGGGQGAAVWVEAA